MYYLKFEPNDLGFVPQDNGIIGNYHFDAPNSIRNYKFNSQVEGLWVPDGIKFRHRAKFTDMLCCIQLGYPFMVISDKFKEIILHLRLPKYQSFPIKVIKKDKIIQYNIFISKEYFAEYIDFEKSNFFVGIHQKNRATLRESTEIKGASDFWKRYNHMAEGTYIGGTEIILNYSLIEYDLFRLPRGLGGPFYIVSEAFVEAANQAGLTGIYFLPFDKWYSQG